MSKGSAAVEKTRIPVNIDPAYVGRLTGILLGICVVVALMLGVVNAITEPIIRQMQEEKTAAAMAQVLEAERYDEVESSFENVTALYGAYNGAQQVGYVVEVTASGFGGAMSLVVGVDMNGLVTGVSVTKNAETKNIGTKVTDDAAVLARFAGMGGTITVNSGSNRFDGITGATVTSKAVTAGVNTALAAVAALKG
ncbi:MAG: FMN-binding protein [Oscillospiraceae bacterium]|nr:FMN-binding protein [Oscillospiraceae bacterium]